MKKLVLLISFIVGFVLTGLSQDDYNVMIGENLNLKVLGEIIMTSSNPQQIEERLNRNDGVNNLDLDGNGIIDYLKVIEYDYDNDRVYSVRAVLENSEPEVAQVRINTINQFMIINGNQLYYGDNNYYRMDFAVENFLLWSYLIAPPVYYVSPYHYGYYGYGYRPSYRPVPYHVYYNRPNVSSYRMTPRIYYNHPPRPNEPPRHFQSAPPSHFPPQHYNQPIHNQPQHFNQPPQHNQPQRSSPPQHNQPQRSSPPSNNMHHK